MRRIVSLLFLVLWLGSCSSPHIPFRPNAVSPPRIDVKRSMLVAGDWLRTLPAGQWRQTVLFEWHGRKLPMVGLLYLDRANRRVRLLALNDMGMKLFWAQFDHDLWTLHVFHPNLERYTGLSDLLKDALKNLLLVPSFSSEDRMTLQKDGYLLHSSLKNNHIWYRLTGSPPLLTAYGSAVDDWRVDFYQIEQVQGYRWPRGMILRNDRWGYRLIVRNEEFVIDAGATH